MAKVGKGLRVARIEKNPWHGYWIILRGEGWKTEWRPKVVVSSSSGRWPIQEALDISDRRWSFEEAVAVADAWVRGMPDPPAVRTREWAVARGNWGTRIYD